MDFSAKLLRLLKDNKTQQKDLAKAIGVSPQAVSQYVKGLTFPDIEKAKRIADYFNVGIGYLLSDDYDFIPFHELDSVKDWCLKRGGDRLWQAVHGLLGLTAEGLDKVNDRIEELNELKRYSLSYQESLQDNPDHK